MLKFEEVGREDEYYDFNEDIIVNDTYAYISDSAQVQIFDLNGKFIKQLDGNFSSPAGLTFGDRNCLLVVDRGTNRIQEFRS